jgi:hypothetical protein
MFVRQIYVSAACGLAGQRVTNIAGPLSRKRQKCGQLTR